MFNWVEKFLKKLEKANKETFKGEVPDCCKLNNDKKIKK
ncbi:LDCC motif putative metal-binding protein [Thermoanaerobacterium sp. RBIITD]|nr:LDCC motif putative metal-binding protein [Thermoanaerobacterium sp. RBIITD]SNX54749.1 hypothetical protein SAMN05660242_2464 [Thermoanaerobacterium sp. RBIITD]